MKEIAVQARCSIGTVYHFREPGGVLVDIARRGTRCREGQARQGHPNQDTNIEVRNEICVSHLEYLEHSTIFMYNITSYHLNFAR